MHGLRVWLGKQGDPVHTPGKAHLQSEIYELQRVCTCAASYLISMPHCLTNQAAETPTNALAILLLCAAS
jgi:hypothetical protein